MATPYGSVTVPNRKGDDRGAPDPLRRVLLLPHNTDDCPEQTPLKKGTSMAEMLMDNALNVAIYTGAAAVTAYSIWSNWGREEEDDQDGDGDDSCEESSNNPESPLVLMEEPPPPYVDQRESLHRPTSSPSKMSRSPSRPSHIFVSSRKGRPAFKSIKTKRSRTPRKRVIPTSDSSTSQASSATVSASDDEFKEQDDLFARMQSQMSNLIEEGNRALRSRVNLDEEESDPPAMKPIREDLFHSPFERKIQPPNSMQSSPITRTNSICPTSPLLSSPSLRMDRGTKSPRSRIPRLGGHTTLTSHHHYQ